MCLLINCYSLNTLLNLQLTALLQYVRISLLLITLHSMPWSYWTLVRWRCVSIYHGRRVLNYHKLYSSTYCIVEVVTVAT